jgi:hypothetical protein
VTHSSATHIVAMCSSDVEVDSFAGDAAWKRFD